ECAVMNRSRLAAHGQQRPHAQVGARVAYARSVEAVTMEDRELRGRRVGSLPSACHRQGTSNIHLSSIAEEGTLAARTHPTAEGNDGCCCCCQGAHCHRARAPQVGTEACQTACMSQM